MSGCRLRALGVAAACALVGLGLLIGLLVASAQELGSTSTIRIGVLKDGSYDVVTVPLETYVSRVLAGEALPGSEPAALEALAITIRTYALGNRSRHRAEGFDLCDQTHCQVMRTATPATDRAAHGDRRPGAAVSGRAGHGVLQRVVRRADRKTLERLARRRRSAVPAVAG